MLKLLQKNQQRSHFASKLHKLMCVCAKILGQGRSSNLWRDPSVARFKLQHQQHYVDLGSQAHQCCSARRDGSSTERRSRCSGSKGTLVAMFQNDRSEKVGTCTPSLRIYTSHLGMPESKRSLSDRIFRKFLYESLRQSCQRSSNWTS